MRRHTCFALVTGVQTCSLPISRWSETLALPPLLVGDFNIAPLPSHVWGHNQLLKVVSHTPVEVDALDALRASNSWVDLGRYFHPAPARLHTWWSYRSPDWPRNARGRRLDHMWATREVAAKAVAHHGFVARSAERSVGTECVRPCSFSLSPSH